MLWTKHRSIGKSAGHTNESSKIILETDLATPTLENNVAVTSWFVLEIPSWETHNSDVFLDFDGFPHRLKFAQTVQWWFPQVRHKVGSHLLEEGVSGGCL